MFSHLRSYFTDRQSIAVGVAFWVLGFMFGNWATLIPSMKLRYSFDDAELGLMLLAIPAGAISFNPVASFLISKIGMTKTHFLGFILLGICYAIPFSMPTPLLSAAGLVLTGMSISILNVAMNTCASAIEINQKTSILSTSHGMFSIGLMSGSLLTGAALGFKIAPQFFMYAMCILVILLALFTRKQVFSIPEEVADNTVSGGSKFVFPKGMFLLIVLISLCTNITEGAMADWTAVYMREIVITTPFFIGWGLAGYSFFMALGRFLGDGIIPRFGFNRIIVVGGIITFLGLAIALLLPYTFTAVIGFSLVGAGVSCVSPILYGSATRVPGMAKGGGLATLNTFGMGGFLIGPVIIGFISEWLSLPIALSLVLVLITAWILIARKTKFY
ncbi:MAG: MFS transporter [Spirosomaceae bacterium]|nr:MFS transporter [Spirosomataceae bacterium]